KRQSGILMDVHSVGFFENWGFGDFQFLKSNPNEPEQPIETSHLGRGNRNSGTRRGAGIIPGCPYMRPIRSFNDRVNLSHAPEATACFQNNPFF
ncbi:hypothetical protein, partial [Noviherbaspirillum aridicola]|uniref:hypothetical protein n=1 Tax=Noviherbaspirillum aridicola TaxID=2849687 RepID=UPI001C807A02